MIPYLLWLWLTWRCSALKCGVRSKLKSCKMTQVWQFFSVLMSEVPNVSLVVMHSNMNINMDSNKRVHKQTSMYAWAFKTELKPFNLTEPSQAPAASFVKDKGGGTGGGGGGHVPPQNFQHRKSALFSKWKVPFFWVKSALFLSKKCPFKVTHAPFCWGKGNFPQYLS